MIFVTNDLFHRFPGPLLIVVLFINVSLRHIPITFDQNITYGFQRVCNRRVFVIVNYIIQIIKIGESLYRVNASWMHGRMRDEHGSNIFLINSTIDIVLIVLNKIIIRMWKGLIILSCSIVQIRFNCLKTDRSTTVCLSTFTQRIIQSISVGRKRYLSKIGIHFISQNSYEFVSLFVCIIFMYRSINFLTSQLV